MYGYPLAFTKSRKAVYDAKIIFFGSSGFSFCFFLGACDAKDTDNLFETTQGQTPSVVNPSGSEEKMTGPSAEGSAPTVGDQAAMEEGYSYGNMQKKCTKWRFYAI